MRTVPGPAGESWTGLRKSWTGSVHGYLGLVILVCNPVRSAVYTPPLEPTAASLQHLPDPDEQPAKRDLVIAAETVAGLFNNIKTLKVGETLVVQGYVVAVILR